MQTNRAQLDVLNVKFESKTSSLSTHTLNALKERPPDVNSGYHWVSS